MLTNFRAAASSMEQFGHLSALAGRRFAAFTITTGAVLGTISGIRQMIGEASRFEVAMNKIRQVSGDSFASVKQVESVIDNLSPRLGVSSTALADVSVQLKQAGLSGKDTAIALEAIAKTSLAPNFDSIQQTTEGAIAAFQQFGRDADQISQQLGAMNAVAGAFAVEAGDLVTVVQKAGGAFKTAGGDFNELLAVFTSIRNTTRGIG